MDQEVAIETCSKFALYRHSGALLAPELIGTLLVNGVNVPLVQEDEEHQIVTEHGQPVRTQPLT